MRLIRTTIAALALTLAVPVAAQAATITVGVGTTPAGDATPFTFHVTGPECGATPTDITFTLTDGQAKQLTLCDSPPDLAHRFHVTEVVPAGWTLTAIDCTGTDPDPADAFVVDVSTATAFVELSPNEDKACNFKNAKQPSPPASASPSPPPAGGSAGSPAPQNVTPNTSGVAGEQERSPVRATAAVRAQSRCGVRTARVVVTGRQMRQVRLSVNGQRVRTVKVARGVLRVVALVPLRRSGAAVQRVRARVTFRNGARARTLNATVRRCAQTSVAPQFTG
jgi:hypothetical protein